MLLDPRPADARWVPRLWDMPESRSVIATANRVGEFAALLAETAAMLPENFRNEREATIQQFVTDVQVWSIRRSLG